MRIIKGLIALFIGIFLLCLPPYLGGIFWLFWIFPTFFFVVAHGYLSGEFFPNKN